MSFRRAVYTTAFALIAALPAALPAQAASSPVFTAQLSGHIGDLILGTRPSVGLKLITPEGIHRFVLWPRRPFEPQLDASDSATPGPLLFQGIRVNGSATARGPYNLRVAASLIGSDLSLIFYGKRRGRLFEAHFAVEPDAPASRLSGRIQHYSRYMRIGCGTSIGQTHDSFGAAAAYSSQSLFSPERYLEISTDADYEYYRAYRSQTAATIQSILNTAEAIYTSQLGVRFDIIRQHAFQNREPQPLTSSDSLALLEEFRTARNQRNHLGQADVYQLFTGKNLFGSIIGLSYVGPVCQDTSYSVSLVMRVSDSIQALVSAHEIGHTMGATHPEDTLPSPDDSLMTGIVRPGQTSFSNFSLAEIDAHLDQWDPQAQCLAETRRLRVGLSVHSRDLSSFTDLSIRADLTPAGDASGCEVSLYGSSRSSLLGPSNFTNSRARNLFNAIVSSSHFTLRGSVPRGSSRITKTAYFRAFVECPGSRFSYSPLRKLRVRAYGRNASLSPYFKAARASFHLQ